MFTPHITHLAVDTTAPLLASIEAADGVSRWRRVGTITRTATRLRVELDARAACFLPAWEACASSVAMPTRTCARIKFGVFAGRAGVTVLAVGALTAHIRAAIAATARIIASTRG